MRIAFVTQWFPPEPGMLVASSIADGLASRGHDVDVLTGFPNYPTGRLHDDYPLRPYRREKRSSLVTVHRAPLFPSHDRSAIRRAVNYSSFAVAASVVARTKVPKPDAWLIYSSPATAALPALMGPPSSRAPYYLMVQDLWPDSVTGSGLVAGRTSQAMEHALGRFCNFIYERSAGIGVISPSMRAILTERGVDPVKLYSTPNWVQDDHLSPDVQASDALRSSLGLPSGPMFMYAGNMGELQGLGALVEAFGQCPQANLVLLGGGVARPKLEALAASHGWSNVHFVAPKESDVVGRYIAASDVQVVSLLDTPLLRATMPSKVQVSMAAGRPILAHAAGDVADVVERNGAGRATPPGDVGAASRVVRALASTPAADLRAMGHRARDYYEKNFSPAAGLNQIEAMLIATTIEGP